MHHFWAGRGLTWAVNTGWKNGSDGWLLGQIKLVRVLSASLLPRLQKSYPSLMLSSTTMAVLRPPFPTNSPSLLKEPSFNKKYRSSVCASSKSRRRARPFPISNKLDKSSGHDGEVDNLGVTAALSILRFYKSEISPLLPKSCRYVPTCSEYSMDAYRKYGFAKGTLLTACRLCRCNPLGGSGFDPPRWFDEASPSDVSPKELINTRHGQS